MYSIVPNSLNISTMDFTLIEHYWNKDYVYITSKALQCRNTFPFTFTRVKAFIGFKDSSLIIVGINYTMPQVITYCAKNSLTMTHT